MPRLALICALLFVAVSASAEEFSFDEAELDKKWYHLGGYAEARPGINQIDREAALTRQRYYGRHLDNPLVDFNGKLLLEGSLERGWARLFLQPSIDYTNTRLDNALKLTWYEAYLQAKPNDSFKSLVGKKSLKWGKGYAWSPVAFFDRPKSPDDPELSLEGYWLATADYIRSFDGPLKTMAVTPVLLPQNGDLNDDYGGSDRLNFGGKLYFLLYDADIDLLFLADGSRTERYGFDFSRNITTNLELHGEFAWVRAAARPVVGGNGQGQVVTADATNWLVGLRYLTEQDTTYIVEYYRNGSGYSTSEMQAYFNQINRGYTTWQQNGDAALLQKTAGQTSFTRVAPMQDYLYARVSQKEPFDILYVTPAMTAIVNLDDRSLTIAPELVYTGITNLELRLKGSMTIGQPLSEYGEKQNDARVELRVRWYF
jgi:hypothetical protein